MRKFKKVLAFSLASAMIVSAVPASAATANTAKAGKSTIYYNGNASYKSTWVKTTTKKGYTVKFTNANKAVATLDAKTGKVTAKKAGTAQVKVNFYKSGKYVGNKVVKIAVKASPVGKGIKAEKTTLTVGETTKIVSSNGVKLNCYSADKKVVTVNKTTGVVTAVAAGTTKIAAVNAISGKKVYVEVTVKAADDPVVKQTGRNVITVTNGVSMKDDKITVLRGTSEVAIAKDGIKFTEDGTGITITMAANLADTNYTLKIGERTKEFKGELSKVNEIKILSDKAAVIANADNSSAYLGAKVGYKVENQFGEDITAITSLTVNGSDTPSLDSKNHVIYFTRTEQNPFVLGRDLISVVLVHTETGKSAQATLSISNEAAADTIEFKGVYNREGKALTDDIDLNEEPFYLLFTVNDQYGMKFKSYRNVQLNKDIHVSVLGGLTGLAINPKDEKDDFTVITKDGVDYLALRIRQIPSMPLKAGTAQVLAISGGNGKSMQADLEMQVGGRVETITINPPAYVPAGEKVKFDYTAYDANGNSVTAYKHLSDIKITGGKNDNLKFEKDTNGKAVLVWDGTGDNVTNPGKGRTTLQTYGLETLSHKFTHLQVTVNEQARPVTIDGLQDVSTALTTSNDGTNNAKVDIKVKNLKVIDQYGRVMDKKLLNTALKASEKYKLNNLFVTIKTNDKSKDLIEIKDSIGTLATNSVTHVFDFAKLPDVNADTKLFSVAVKSTAAENMTATVEVAIQNAAENKNDVLTGANADVRFEIVKTSQIKNATVEVDKLYVPTKQGADNGFEESAYQQKIVVKHQGAVLPKSDYEIRFDKGSVLETVAYPEKEDGLDIYALQLKDGINQDNFAGFKTETEVKTKVYITLKSGEEVIKEVILSKEAPKVSSITVKKDELEAAVETKAISEMVSGAGITFEDQYGKELKFDNKVITFTGDKASKDVDKTVDVEYVVADYDAKHVSVTKNGTKDASVEVKSKDAKYFNIKVKVGSLEKTIRVAVK